MSNSSYSGKYLRKNKSIFTLASVFAIMLSKGVFAQIPPVAFKGLSKVYKKKSYDLVIGAAALESGFVHDLRFFGDFEPGYDAKKNRVYIEDKSSDPLWQVIKILLPSPTGALTTERAIDTNFGKNATPKTVALLQNYANALREKTTIDEHKIVNDIVDSFNKDFSVPPDPKIAALKKSISDFEEPKKGLKITNFSTLFKTNKLLWTELEKEIGIIVNDKRMNFDQKKEAVISKVAAHQESKEKSAVSKKKEPFENEVKPLVEAIKQSISKEKGSIYLSYTTEQIISSFFCAKFNTQADIREFIANLDDNIVDKAKLHKEDDYLKEEDLKVIAAKTDPYDLDEIYDLAEADIWAMLTPYKAGAALVSNGNTYKYDRKKDEMLTREATFADCAEKAANHIMNILLYDNINRKFDLEPLKKNIKSDNIYFKNYEDFYKNRTPASANAGDIDTRSKWNKVMGDLNALEQSNPINYMKDTNELNAGFINFVRTFQKIFGLTLDPLPITSLEDKKLWLEKSLNTIFTTVNPNKGYRFDLSKVTETDNDLSGDLDIVMLNRETEESLFSFRFFSVPDSHSDIQNLKTIKKVEGVDYTAELKNHPTSLQANTTDESLWLITSPEVRDSKITNPLYQLFNSPLTDNDSKIAFLNKVRDGYESWKSTFLDTPDKMQTFNHMFGNILADVSWDDKEVLRVISPLIMSLSGYTDLQSTLFEKVRGLSLDSTDQLEMINRQLHSLEHLYYKSFSGETFSLQNLNKLKHLDLSLSKVKNIELENLPNFEELILSNVNLEGISLKNIEKLKKIDVQESFIKSIGGQVSQVEELRLDSSNIEGIFLRNMVKLKKVSLYLSNIKNIDEQLENLYQLEELRISYSKLERFFLKDLSNLKVIQLLETPIKKVVLENFSQLDVLKLSYNHYIEEISLKNLGNLENLDLNRSAARKIELSEGLSNLTTLDLSETSKLEELEFKEDMKDLKINLRGSKITQKTQIKGFEHLDEDNITW